MADTSTEWSSYLSALTSAPGTSIAQRIGAYIASLRDDDQIIDYANRLMLENPDNTRAYEIGWDVRALRMGLIGA
jgi:hypothetical protein